MKALPIQFKMYNTDSVCDFLRQSLFASRKLKYHPRYCRFVIEEYELFCHC